MSECGLRPMESYRYMSTETGGDDCVGHTMIDHLNYCYKLKMKQIDGKDSQTLVNKLYDIQSIDPEFFFRVRLNAEEKVECLFWRDSMMREDYKIYGDVLVFDTIFRTNKYNLICAPFVGYGRKAPYINFTDQDAAIAAGIEQVFPSSRHRLCLWHLSKNANSRFGLLKSDKKFKNAFYKCLSGCITPNDFEETWKSMINTFKLEKDDWFNRLYGLKEKWCTALSKDFFFLSAANVYTITLFRDFEEEFKLSVASSTMFKGSVGRTVFFEVWIEGITGLRQEVQNKMEDSTVTCTCKNFEESGWLYYNLILKGHKIAKARKFIEEKFKTDNKAVDEIIKKEEERKAKEEAAKIAEQEKAKAEAQRQTQDEESTNSEITIVLDPDRANTKGKITILTI
ncbi:protein FAR1-RELATED SEQUENCE 5-like [Spinacia oleracea]|uniref:Protein FAR1-RELATED SEQUENCE 5-like n=1 Tax=Spinacia oleracea TaxID=3562 RepID=A0ABM3RHV0_SPIOL|nr:protein FAR1-RELATED SEQUENCE 5-like [Spinacia oleracea]